MKNTFEGKFIAVFMSVVLVMSMTSIFAFAGNAGEQVPADETATEQPAKAFEPLVTTAVDEAVVTFEPANAYVSVRGQVLSSKNLITELHKELQFSASSDIGFELESISAKNTANADVPVTTQDGISTIAAEYVDSTLVVAVKAKASETEEAPVVETDPITKDTVIGDDEAEDEGDAPEAGDAGVPQDDEPGAEVGERDADAGITLMSDDGARILDAGEKIVLEGAAGKKHSWTVSPGSYGKYFDLSLSDNKKTATITGKSASGLKSFTVTHEYRFWGKHTETWTIQVVAEDPTSISVSGADNVVQFGTAALTADFEPSGSSADTTWESSDPGVFTVDSDGMVKGVGQGTATVTVRAKTAAGNVLSASKQITVTAPEATGKAQFYYMKTPTSYPKSNDVGQWGTSPGVGTVNASNATWEQLNGVDKNTFDSVADRVISWPSGFEGGIVPKTSGHWEAIFNAFKSTVGDVSADDVESIILHPYKMSKDNGGSCPVHVDCTVEIKVKDIYTATYYLRDAEGTGFEWKAAETVRAGGTASLTSELAKLPRTKTVGRRTYTLAAWFDNGKMSGAAVAFPYAVSGNVNFYAKYIGGFYVKYDLVGGSWTNTSTRFERNEGDTVYASNTVPTRAGYVFAGWKYSEDDGLYPAGKDFTMPAKDVTLSAQWAVDSSQTYTVSYEAENGTIVGEASNTGIQVRGTNGVTGSRAEAKQGYTFEGWYVNGAKIEGAEAELSPELTAANINNANGVYADTAFTAKFAANAAKVSVWFYASTDASPAYVVANDGALSTDGSDNKHVKEITSDHKTGYSESELQSYANEAYALTPETDRYEGYVIWVLDKDKNWTEVENNDLSSYTIKGGDEIRYHVIPEVAHAVAYEAGEHGTGSPQVDYSFKGESLTVKSLDDTGILALPGYRFDGWASNDSSVTAVGDSFTMPAEKNVTFTAQWVEQAEVALAYQAEQPGGRVSNANGQFGLTFVEHVAPATGTPVGSTAAPRPGYEFEGWYVGEECVSSDAKLSQKAIDQYAKTSGAYRATTFVAKFVESEDVTISYVADEGGSVDSSSETLAPATGKANGSTATAKRGWHFVNWTTEVDGVDAVVGNDSTLTPELVDQYAKAEDGVYLSTEFTAHFEQDEVVLRYVASEGGSVSLPEETVKTFQGPSKIQGSIATASEGYYFAGWTVEGSDTIISSKQFLTYEIVAGYAADEEGAYTATTFVAKFAPKADVELIANSDEVVYNGQEQRVSGFTSSVEGLSFEGIIAEARGTDAGTYEVGFTIREDSFAILDAEGNDVTDRYSFATMKGKLVINPAKLAVATEGGSKVYNGEPLTNPSMSVEGLVDGEILSFSATGFITDVGEARNTYALRWEAGATSARKANYRVASEALGTLKVTEGEYGVQASDYVGTYDGRPHGITVVAPADAKVTFDTDNAYVDVTGAVTVGYTVDRPNYRKIAGSQTVTINPATVKVSAVDQSKKYGEDDPALTLGSPSSSVQAETPAFSGELVRAPGEAVGGYAIGRGTVRLANNEAAGFKASNYALEFAPGTLTISSAPLDPEGSTGIQVDNPRDVQYNGKEQKWTPTVFEKNNHELEAGIDYTVSYSGDVTNVGGVTVAITGVGNYEGTVERTYSITPAPAVIHVNDASKLFSANDPVFSGSIEGVFGTDSLGDVAYRRTNGDDTVGTYEGVLTAVVDNLNPNYTYTVEPGMFTIEPADSNIVRIATEADGLVKTYDGQPSSITAEADINGSTLLYSADGEEWFGESPTFTNVGAYIVYVKATHPGYEETAVVSATIVINKAPVVITVADSSKIAGTADPVFTGAIEGLVADGDLGTVTYVRSGSAEEVGVYADVLTARYDEHANYLVTVVTGSFTITAAATPAPVTPVTPTPGAPTPAPMPTSGTVPAGSPIAPTIVPVVDALATAAETVIGDNATPLAQNAEPGETEIGDNETPLAGVHAWCWVHWYIILGIIVTAVYAAWVALHRGLFSHKLKRCEDDLIGGDDPVSGAPSPDGHVAAPVPPKGAPAGATLVAGSSE